MMESSINELRKAIACELFLDNLGDYLSRVNDDFVRCGCERCTDMYGGNYPNDEEYNRGDTTLKCWEPGYWVSSTGPINIVPIEKCLLYEWFKQKCVDFKVIVPDDNIDHPKFYPRSFDINLCLGRHLDSGGLGDFKNRWRYKIKQLTYNKQVKTIYRLLHHIDYYGFDDSPTFDEWFCVKGVSLLG